MYRITSLILLLLIAATSFAQVSEKKKITLEDIWRNGTFNPRTVSGLNPMNDGKHYASYYTNPSTRKTYLLQYNYATGAVTDTILRFEDLVFNGKMLQPQGYSFSADEKQIMIITDREAIYRRSSKENNFIYNRANKTISELSSNGKQLFATFSPDGKKVAFVRENDLFIKDLTSNTERKITNDGKWNFIINGGADWVYEEEFSFARAFFWSPDGKKIAYYKFNEANVKEFSMTMYDGLYPSEYKFKYPKAGEVNAIVSIHIHNLEMNTTKNVNIGSEKDQYIPRIQWTQDPNMLCVQRMNRHQNKLEYLIADANTGETRTLLTETSDTYIDINDDLTFLADKKSFIITSEKDGYQHVYHYDLNGKLINQITKGNWEVSRVYGIDEKNKTVYYQSTESSPLQRDVYAIGFNGKNKRKLNASAGTNNAVFTADYSFFINYHTAVGSPTYVSLHDNKGKMIRVLEDNTALKSKLTEYDLGTKEFLTIPTIGGVQLNAWMIKPSNFDPNKKYPVFMFVYGGPGSQTVTDSWGGANEFWYHMLAQQGYIVVSVDNRGTGARGAEFKKMTYLELGKYETIDQIEAGIWLANQSYVDANRIGIQGWSYGGYMSSLAITKGADVFKMAIAVAPVTHWKFYDTIYTERFLRTPQENKSGYEDNSPINFVNQLKGSYLIIHGTADDNVHFQNASEMVKALVNANKKFESAFYPDKNHGISGGNTRLQLYGLMTDFILRSL